jgi:hypothetical protein
LLVLGCCLVASAAAEARDYKWFGGGGIGLGFGKVDWVDISGLVGYRVTPRFSTGVRALWRSRDNDVGSGDKVSTTDYGASLFGRYRVAGPFYAQLEYEYLSYEYIRFDRSTERDEYDSVLVGGGLAHPLSPKVVLFATGLYNVTYDDDELPRPYDSPWIFRAGVSFAF